MNIHINNKAVTPQPGETLIEVARREGFDIPSLCYAQSAKHKSSCMVCAVKNSATGQIIPSCTTLPTEGMQIETDCAEVHLSRTLSLELLLSDHRADCEAPCRMACPGGLDVARMNRLYDAGRFEEAGLMLRDTLVIPATLCYICNAPCEKICRKKDFKAPVRIRDIKKQLVFKTPFPLTAQPATNAKRIAILGSDPAALAAAYHLQQCGLRVSLFEPSTQLLAPYIDTEKLPSEIMEMELFVIQQTGVDFFFSAEHPDLEYFDGVITTLDQQPAEAHWIRPQSKSKQPARLILEGHRMAERMLATLFEVDIVPEPDKLFNSTYSRFNDSEKATLSAEILSSGDSKCLYCDCDRKDYCKLRLYASEYGIKSSRYNKSSAYDALRRQRIKENMYFEPSKCIRCGLCVYNSDNGFTFRDRGFVMQVVLPEENAANVSEQLASLCPTGAIYLRR